MSVVVSDFINPIDVDTISSDFRNASPFPHFTIDGFLRRDLADEIAASYPRHEQAEKIGHSFSAVNESKKVQICDSAMFPTPVAALSRVLAAPAFVETLESITGIPHLLADEQLVGGGMHVMGPGGRLDVHVDFNRLEERGLFRRLNLLIFFNPGWQETWGGQLDLWDAGVRKQAALVPPILNRCAVFQTSEISFHGVTKVRCPKDRTRQSFAAYYYTREAPAGWDGKNHTTIFRARPSERFRGAVLMPAERALRALRPTLRRAKRALLGRG